MIFTAEEFPAERRGFVIAVIQAARAMGSIKCAAVTPLLVLTPLGWCAVYFVGVGPTLLVTYGWRVLKETRRYAPYTR